VGLCLAWPAQVRAEPLSDDGAAEESTEESGEAPKAPSVVAPDLVILENGNRYRGTIAELDKGRSVTIVLANGETRKFDYDDIEYAGPADEAPSARRNRARAESPDRSPEPEIREGQLQYHALRFSSDRSGARLLLRSQAESKLSVICTAPCTRKVEAQTYTVAVHVPEKGTFHIDDPVVIEEPTRLTAQYRSREGVRGAGLLVSTLSAAVLGVVLFVAADGNNAGTLGWTAAAAGGIGIFVGIGLAATSDKVIVRATPLSQ
jgi:hypothetical protein